MHFLWYYLYIETHKYINTNENKYLEKSMSNNEASELKQIFDELHLEHKIEEMATFSEIDIAEKLQKNEMMVIRYKELYYNELNKYEILERKLDALKGIRYKHYRFNDEHEWQKKEIEDYCLPSDEKIIKMKKMLQKQQVRVRFFDMCWKAFNSMGWSMKTFTERERHGL
jgi:hypothetical protein